MQDRKVAEIMTTPVVTIRADDDMHTAAERMLAHDIGCLPVVDGAERVVGMVTDGDFVARDVGIPFSTFRRPQVLGRWLGREGVERIYERARTLKVADVMSRPVHTVGEDATLAELLEVMLRRDVKHVPVVRDGRLVGIVARHDLLRLVMDEVQASRHGEGGASGGPDGP